MNHSQNDFTQLTIAEWKLKVQAELSGLDYNEILVWDTAEGIQVKPVYTKEDVENSLADPIVTQKDWKIIGKFLNQSNQDTSYLYGFRVQENHLDAALQLPNHLDLFIECKKPFDWVKTQDISKSGNLKYLGLDIIGNLAETGNWFKSQEEDFELLAEILLKNQYEKSIEINASLYQNAGANHVQQIAFSIAHAVEYLEKFGKETASKIYFRTAVGGNYFFEIAKLRSIRKLWKLILESYEMEAETFIFAESSMRNKSLFDIENNLIRSGLEASSAIQGKADAIHISGYDSLKLESSFSEELASKQQLLLQKESYFDKMEDPVSGSYFVENLSELMVKNALDFFKNIEADGGFLQNLMDGSIQKMVQKAADKEQLAFDEGKLILIGVNKFRNPNDEVVSQSKIRNEIRTKIQPIFPKRLAEKIENSIQK